MSDLLAVAALVISAAALLLAWRAASAAEAHAAFALARIEALRAAAPPSRPAMPVASSATDPSVLVRLDALESRQASLDLRAEVGPGNGDPSDARDSRVSRVSRVSRMDELPGAPAAGGRAHPMFP